MTPGKLRALVAEDSPTTRALLVQLLESDPDIQVVGEATNGREAIELTRRLRPSVVVMDIRMPILDGLEATRCIMNETPTPVVVVSAVAARDVELGLRAMQFGALTVLPKPPPPDSAAFPVEAARLVSLIKALADVKVVRRRIDSGTGSRRQGDGASGARTSRRFEPKTGNGTVEVVAVAASTGGPAALHRLLERLPPDMAAPVLVVQHIAEGFTQGLVSWLSRALPLAVKLAEHGERLAPATVYIGPEHRHLEIGAKRTVVLRDGPPLGGFRPSANVLFRSVAENYGAEAAAVVLTGMGRDGLEGVETIKRAGGRVLVQDEASCVVFGMPGVVVAAGLADDVAPVEQLAEQLTSCVRRRS